MLNLSRKLILASGSPRRADLLRQAGIAFEVKTKSIPEDYPGFLSPYEIPVYLAEKKAEACKDFLEKEDAVLLTADTIVSLDGKILGKPADAAEALTMIGSLSGRQHEVITGVCLTDRGKKRSFNSKTIVYFKKLNKEEISWYIDQCRPFDKAGAYAIQEWIGLIGVEKIEGDYFNVIGLPVTKVYQALKEF